MQRSLSMRSMLISAQAAALTGNGEAHMLLRNARGNFPPLSGSGRTQLRRLVVLALCVVPLSGCAALDDMKSWLVAPEENAKPAEQKTATTAQPPTPVPVVSQKPKRPAHENPEPSKEPGPVPAKGPEKVAAIDPDTLIGLDPAAVEKLLGTPAIVTKGTPALVYTYMAAGCSFRVFFYPDLKTSTFHALKYGGVDVKGDEIGTSHACIRNLLTARNNGPG